MKKYLYLILSFLLLSCQFDSELIIEKIGKEDLPKDIQIKGEMLDAFKWKDSNGLNILILSAKGPIVIEKEYGEPSVSKKIYADQYLVSGSEVVLLWDIVDLNMNCPMHVEIDFIPNSTTITDLNKDGITETTIAYMSACRSDVSLGIMKVLMHENNMKYGLRGKTLIAEWHPNDKMEFSNYEYCLETISDSTDFKDNFEKHNGRFENYNDFANAPVEFKDHALKVWKENVKEKF